jgi:hypothetical protein
MSNPAENEKPPRSDQDIINEKNVRALDAAAIKDRIRIDKLQQELEALRKQNLDVLKQLTELKSQLMIFIATRSSGATK